jgi:hypothetical protein
MRIRTVKPDFWKNERMCSLPEFTRLLALALLNYADDEGYFPANVVIMRGELFPLMEDSLSIQGALTELSRIDYVRIASAKDGRKYGWVVNFTKHQRINRPTPSTIKHLCEFIEDSLSNHGGLTEDSLRTHCGNGREGNGTGKGKEGSPEGSTLALEPFPTPAKKTKPPVDDEWLELLSKDPTYAGIDVKREFGKMANWCNVKRKRATRQRFINWLNRAEKPMAGAPGSQYQPAKKSILEQDMDRMEKQLKASLSL